MESMQLEITIILDKKTAQKKLEKVCGILAILGQSRSIKFYFHYVC